MSFGFDKIVSYQTKVHYASPKELKYSSDPGFLLSPYDYESYLSMVEGSLSQGIPWVSFPLKSFNSPSIYYCHCSEITNAIDDLTSMFQADLLSSGSLLSDRDPFDFDRSRIYSEIEGSVNVEEVPTTRRRLKELLEEGAPAKERNDVIIKNMAEAIRFVHRKPAFNKDNLLHLYHLLSEGCLDEEDRLPEGAYYRDDGVEVDGVLGCPKEKIDECMDSLFAFVESSLHGKDSVLRFLLPHICHYYVLYIHPYFDYNGRTARMVSYWIYLLSGDRFLPPLVSEAINQTKSAYYQAIRDSRTAHNDLTYFLRYLLSVSVRYSLSYQDLESIDRRAKDLGVPLTETDLHYLKRVLVCYPGPFGYQDFERMCHIEISKQGALKLLNRYLLAGALKEAPSKSKAKLFALNEDVVRFTRKEPLL